jgi:hypothetical protein
VREKQLKPAAKERQKENGRRKQSPPQKVANLPPIEKSTAREKAAESVNVSPRTISNAKAVLDKGLSKVSPRTAGVRYAGNAGLGG